MHIFLIFCHFYWILRIYLKSKFSWYSYSKRSLLTMYVETYEMSSKSMSSKNIIVKQQLCPALWTRKLQITIHPLKDPLFPSNDENQGKISVWLDNIIRYSQRSAVHFAHSWIRQESRCLFKCLWLKIAKPVLIRVESVLPNSLLFKFNLLVLADNKKALFTTFKVEPGG